MNKLRTYVACFITPQDYETLWRFAEIVGDGCSLSSSSRSEVMVSRDFRSDGSFYYTAHLHQTADLTHPIRDPSGWQLQNLQI